MKKQKFNSLSFKKEIISNLNAETIKGGKSATCDPPGVTESTCIGDGGSCGFGSDECGGGGGGSTTTPAPTSEPRCGLNTIDLSYCQGLTIPDPCLSTGVCA